MLVMSHMPSTLLQFVCGSSADGNLRHPMDFDSAGHKYQDSLKFSHTFL